MPDEKRDADPLQPTPALLEKLAGIVHTAFHDLPVDSPTRVLCFDDEVIAWAKAMQNIGRLPDPAERN